MIEPHLDDQIATMFDPRRRGGARSLENVAMLQKRKLAGVVGQSTPRPVDDLWWRPIQTNALAKQPGVWHAGHVSAILAAESRVIAGTQTGGVWLIREVYGAFPAHCLSEDWDSPNITCLAFVPGRTDQFFAGTDDGVLYLVEIGAVVGPFQDSRSTRLPGPDVGKLYAMVVLPSSRRIIVAGSSGVAWSAIPDPATQVAAYNWQLAVGLTDGAISGLAVSSNDSIIAAAWGANLTTGHHGFFVGTWPMGQLTFSKPPNLGVDTTKMFRVSVASCARQPARLYAVAASSNSGASDIRAVVRSDDSGQTWRNVAVPSNSGFQGEYNNCIAVSPSNPDVVVIGWRGGGSFYSSDGGANWGQPHTDAGPTDDPHLHADLHALYFESLPWGERLFIGSDGGVCWTRDLGLANNSEFAREVANLQFYAGSLDASRRFPGLVAGGTQDNGNMYCRSVPNPDFVPEPIVWYPFEGGDGGPNRIIDDLGAVIRYNNTLLANGKEYGNQVRIQFWDEQNHRFTGRIPNGMGGYTYAAFAWDPDNGDYGDRGRMVKVEGGGNVGPSGGLVSPLMEVVQAPSWRWDGQLMSAVASPMNQPSGSLYGLFPTADGTGARWRWLMDVGAQVTSLASWDGSTVLVATSDGRMLAVNTTSRQATAMQITDGLGKGAFSLIAVTATRSFAYFYNATTWTGTLCRYNGNTWEPVSVRSLTALALDPAPGSLRVFVSTDDRVLISKDNGLTWGDASKGLPQRSHCTDLRVGLAPNGGRDLYLATYGRAVWRARIENPPTPPHELPAEYADIIFGVVSDGGGLVRIGTQIIPIPPRSPLRDVLTAVAVHQMAEGLSEAHGRELRRTALNIIMGTAEAAAQKL